MVELFKKFESKSHGIIGKLPAQWIYAIPFEKRPQIIKNIFANFGEEFAKLRNKKPDTDSFARITAGRQITKLLKQSGVLMFCLDKNNECNIHIKYDRYERSVPVVSEKAAVQI